MDEAVGDQLVGIMLCVQAGSCVKHLSSYRSAQAVTEEVVPVKVLQDVALVGLGAHELAAAGGPEALVEPAGAELLQFEPLVLADDGLLADRGQHDPLTRERVALTDRGLRVVGAELRGSVDAGNPVERGLDVADGPVGQEPVQDLVGRLRDLTHERGQRSGVNDVQDGSHVSFPPYRTTIRPAMSVAAPASNPEFSGSRSSMTMPCSKSGAPTSAVPWMGTELNRNPAASARPPAPPLL